MGLFSIIAEVGGTLLAGGIEQSRQEEALRDAGSPSFADAWLAEAQAQIQAAQDAVTEGEQAAANKQAFQAGIAAVAVGLVIVLVLLRRK
jgi:CHASE3 domain sensor protein